MPARIVGVVAVLLLFGGGGAAAQVAWDSPFFGSTRPTLGLGLYLMEPAGGDLGFMLTFRGSGRGPGFRVGIAEGRDDQLTGFGGIDFAALLSPRTREVPIEVAAVGGVGLGVGDDGVLVSAPIGVTLGVPIRSGAARFTPYVTPRLVVDAFFGDLPGVDNDDLDLELVADLGIDFAFNPSFAIRIAATLGNRDAVAVGVVF